MDGHGFRQVLFILHVPDNRSNLGAWHSDG